MYGSHGVPTPGRTAVPRAMYFEGHQAALKSAAVGWFRRMELVCGAPAIANHNASTQTGSVPRNKEESFDAQSQARRSRPRTRA